MVNQAEAYVCVYVSSLSEVAPLLTFYILLESRYAKCQHGCNPFDVFLLLLTT